MPYAHQVNWVKYDIRLSKGVELREVRLMSKV